MVPEFLYKFALSAWAENRFFQDLYQQEHTGFKNVEVPTVAYSM